MKSSARIGGHPIHPMLIPLPLGLWTASVIFNLLGGAMNVYVLHTVAYFTALAGCIGALLAAIPGTIDLFAAIPSGTKPRSIATTHGLINLLALALFLVSLWLRPSPSNMTYGAYFTAIAGFVAIGISGWLGGDLVYKHRVGVEEPTEAR
ncbi:MAG TPA: DUF2231 domain-containing protein [Gemmatimonadaceae bacterium]|jgi:uncharacterized membrane protein|nr:DUF2231 domain-containing protein [Gemmatimonadaceae bacterium]